MSLLKKELSTQDKLLMLNRIGQTILTIEQNDLHDYFDDIYIELQSLLTMLSTSIDYADYANIDKINQK